MNLCLGCGSTLPEDAEDYGIEYCEACAGCSGQCLSGYDIGIESGEIAYPHPDCPLHGKYWMPFDNEWSRNYVAEHPERFPSE